MPVVTTNPISGCPLCAGHDTAAPFARDTTREYLRCAQCNLVFVPPQFHPATDVERQRYDLHQNNPSDPGYRRFLSQLTEPMIARLSAGAKGLDFGCGPTAALALLFEETGFKMCRYDPFYQPHQATLKQAYDFVACSEVVEHFFHPTREWKLLDRLVRTGGLLGIQTGLREPGTDFLQWWYREDITHVCFYSRLTFEWLARSKGLTVEFSGKSVVLLGKPAQLVR